MATTNEASELGMRKQITIINKHGYSNLLECATKSLGVNYPKLRRILLSSFSRSSSKRIIIVVRKIQGILRKCGCWNGQEDSGRLYFVDCFTLMIEAIRFFGTSRNITPMHPRRS